MQLVEVSFGNKKLLMLKQGVVIANLVSHHPLYKHLAFELEIHARKSNRLHNNSMSKHPSFKNLMSNKREERRVFAH